MLARTSQERETDMKLKLKKWVTGSLPRLEWERLELDLRSLNQDTLSGEQRFHLTRITNMLCDRPKPRYHDG
jgi:hypothetical protein